MIQVINDGVYRVIVKCDACGKEITDAALAMYTWAEKASDRPRQDGQLFTPHFYHKGQCAESTAFNNQFPLWDELSRFPVYLGENINVDWEWARESAERVSQL